MRRGGIINAQLAGVLADLRHTDSIVVADSGLPVPSSVEVVDLAVVYGEPSFEVVLRAVLAEIVVERATVAEEIGTANVPCLNLLKSLIDGVGLTFLPHESFKLETAGARAVIRTGEATPYANVNLVCGVPFG